MTEDLLIIIILGVVQGLTEFLPVSSSGHLELAKYFLNTDLEAGQSLLLTIILHFATALSTIFVFRNEVLQLIKGLFTSGASNEKWFSWFVFISMLPAAILGLFFEEQVAWFFDQNILLVSAMLAVTGILLIAADFSRKTNRKLNTGFAIIIGIAQAISTIPGISRSGATIASSVLLKIDRELAARFSFLMVVPLILGKVILDLFSGEIVSTNFNIPTIFIGFLVAFITGVLACRIMIKLVQKSKLRYFGYYCFMVAFISWIIVSYQ